MSTKTSVFGAEVFAQKECWKGYGVCPRLIWAMFRTVLLFSRASSHNIAVTHQHKQLVSLMASGGQYNNKKQTSPY